MLTRPEILSPAGNFEKMRFAIFYGADAVYLAGKSFGMRVSSDNFSDRELREAVEYAHNHNVRVYITVNVMPHPDEISALCSYLEYLESIHPDALIVSDIGVFSLAKKHCPSIELHISTQANTVNAESCNMWYSLGAKRIVLARELSFGEIEKIREKIPSDLELEAFVHGSMCISMSGRCLLSNFYTGRDANRGMCAQVCRWEFCEDEKHLDVYEKKRPEDVLSLVENNNGTFMFSSKDLCMIEHIDKLCRSGINSFKIEGRVKSAYYTAVTANAYKTEVLKYFESPDTYKFDGKALYELESVSHREYDTGYFFGDLKRDAKVTSDGGYIKEKAFLATVSEVKDGRAYLIQRNKALDGQECEIVSPMKNSRRAFLCDMRDEHLNRIESAPHPQMLYSVKADAEIKAGDIIRGC